MRDTTLSVGDYQGAIVISFKFKWEPRDLWIGAYVGDDTLYICLIPTLVFKISWKILHVAPLLADMVDRGEGLMKYEPRPIPNDGTPIWDLVVADMEERNRIGTQKYGTPLQANHGRDTSTDAYQEALDLVVYLRQVLEERNE